VKPAGRQQFRLRLIFYDELESMYAIPLNGLPGTAGDEPVGGIVRGKEGLTSLISEVGLDSEVRTRQTDQQELGDSKPPVLERTFIIRSPSQIISLIEGRFAAYREAEENLILADRPLTERDVKALPAFEEDIVLGSTKLSPSDGFERLKHWFSGRAFVQAQP
jgi:hypothetical protein